MHPLEGRLRLPCGGVYQFDPPVLVEFTYVDMPRHEDVWNEVNHEIVLLLWCEGRLVTVYGCEVSPLEHLLHRLLRIRVVQISYARVEIINALPVVR